MLAEVHLLNAERDTTATDWQAAAGPGVYTIQ